MSPRSWRWCWVVALLLGLGPVGAAEARRRISIDLARPCVRYVGDSWEQKSPNGRFELQVTKKQGDGAHATLYELKLLRGARTAWTIPFVDVVPGSYTWLAPDGRYVALLRPDGQLMLVNAEGQLARSWMVPDYLSPAEKARLPKNLCDDLSWAHRGRFIADRFELEVPATQPLRESGQPYKPTVLRLDLKALTLVRWGAQVSGKDTELIQAFEATEEQELRQQLADELLGRSQLKEHLKSRELTAFWNKLLLAPEVRPPVLHRLAVEAVAAYGLESEVRALARLPGEFEGRDVAVLDVLARRFPEEAGEYAVRVLDTRYPGTQVRRRALQLLLELEGAREMAVGFALSESDPELRQLAFPALSERPYTAQRFEKVLGFCEDPTMHSRVEDFVLRTYGNVDASTREDLMEVLRRNESRFLLGQCPELALALGAILENRDDRPRAVELYTRGLRGLEERKGSPPLHPWLMMEAMLQVAHAAEKKGERAEAERYARRVLADDSRRVGVCAPEIRPLSGSCAKERRAEQVARELLKRLKSKPRGASAPSAPGPTQ